MKKGDSPYFPEHNRDVMVTYNSATYTGAYRHIRTPVVKTKRGFWSKLFPTHISVPPRYSYFNGVSLPDGWGGDRPMLKDIISWEYYDDYVARITKPLKEQS